VLTDVFRKPLTVGHALVMLAAAAVLAVGATSIAAIPGPDGTIKACIKKRAPNKGALRAIDHNKRCTRRETTLTWNQKGSPGIQGEPGQQGAAGQNGAPGANGSPDSGPDILGKLAPVDGSGSGLDADALDGRPSTDFLPARSSNFSASLPALPLSWTYYDFDTTGAAGTEFLIGSGFIYLERTGTAGEFNLCARNNVAAGYNVPYAISIADDTTAQTGSLVSAVGTTEECDGPFTVASGREFTIFVQGAVIFGTPRGNITGTGTLANRWRLIGLAF
jgi:hypothetical protein